MAISLFCIKGIQAQTDFVQISTDFLSNLRDGKSTLQQEELLKNVSEVTLESQLSNDTKKLVFWINIYNAFIQKVLKDHPEMYEDRGNFFSVQQIPIVQRMMSFEEIEHGMIRHSQYQYFLGYVTNPFASSFEKRLRVEKRDPRIHFALNCGAKDCPPVVVFREKDYDGQISLSTETYLNRISIVDSDEKIVRTTPLMSWFRGDFDGKKGALMMLSRFGVIPETAEWTIDFLDYDWTLDLDNYLDY